MTQRFLVWATQRIMLLFIKIENTGGAAGLGGKIMSSVLNLLLLRGLQSNKVLMSIGRANNWIWDSRKKVPVNVISVCGSSRQCARDCPESMQNGQGQLRGCVTTQGPGLRRALCLA